MLHAGASGVGSAAIQLCKAFGNPCWVSVGSADRLAYCEALGAQGGVVRTDGLEGLRDFGPFDVILDRSAPTMRRTTSSCWPWTGAGC